MDNSNPLDQAQMVHLLRTKYGALDLAVELQHVQSVLTHAEAQSIDVYSPSRWLGDEGDVSLGHVALIAQPSGPPMGIYLGKVITFDTVDRRQLCVIPSWLHQHMPPIFYNACVFDSSITWLINLSRLIALLREND